MPTPTNRPKVSKAERKAASTDIALPTVRPSDLEKRLKLIVPEVNEAVEKLERAKTVSQDALEFQVSI